MQTIGMMLRIVRLATAAVLMSLFSYQAKPVAAQTKNEAGSFLDVENGKIYCQECGTGDEAVVLVHDGVVHSAVWDDVWPAFCKAFHTVRYDRRGYGRSPAATGGIPRQMTYTRS